VFRLTEPLSQELLGEINRHYQDILVEGTFEQRDPLPLEADEPELADLPRLVFSFDRRSMGRLRHLINSINLGRIAPV
jgi:hypothetical protein